MTKSQLLLLLCLLVASAIPALADTVQVDTRHAVNTIRPTEALGAGVDRLPYGAADKLLVKSTIDKVLSAGWQTVTYRQNTELHTEAWHWNPRGHWSAPAERGYFVGDAGAGSASIVHSYGYPLPRRGVTRDDGTDTVGYSRLTDGDEKSFWKSNPYLAKAYTGQEDAVHPQWIIVDLASRQAVQAIRLQWVAPFATKYLVQFWTGEDPIRKPTAGAWQLFPYGERRDRQGGTETFALADAPVAAQFIRVVMTESSNTCVDSDSSDPRNCVGYAVAELGIGSLDADQRFHDLLRHTPDQDQTATYCSSVDPWHRAQDLDEQAGEQVGFDRFFTSGITRGLPAMVPIAMIYSTPEDAVSQIRYLKARNYPISYIEMGEEPDGHYMLPEDYGELYVQFAHALHQLDPRLKLGGPVFTGQNEDILSWPDASGNASWTARFISYLKMRGKLGELAFFSFEHYPVDPGKVMWSSLYDEAKLVTHIMDVWRQDGVPKDVPLFITESNISSQHSEAYLDLWGGLWLADYIGAFLAGGGDAVYYFHYLPAPLQPGHNASPGTFNFFSAGPDLRPRQPLAQFYVSQLINLEWMQPGSAEHQIFAAHSDIDDGAGHSLVTAYPVRRPDGSWAVMLVNKDQNEEHAVRIEFVGENKTAHLTGKIETRVFGRSQYQWHPELGAGRAEPDDPPMKGSVLAGPDTRFVLPPASVTVLRGSLD
jgi:F5/8 type C domain